MSRKITYYHGHTIYTTHLRECNTFMRSLIIYQTQIYNVQVMLAAQLIFDTLKTSDSCENQHHCAFIDRPSCYSINHFSETWLALLLDCLDIWCLNCMQPNGYFSHVHTFCWDLTRTRKGYLCERNQAYGCVFCLPCCMDESIAFFLEMNINYITYMIWKLPLYEVGNGQLVLEHRVCWPFAY